MVNTEYTILKQEAKLPVREAIVLRKKQYHLDNNIRLVLHSPRAPCDKFVYDFRYVLFSESKPFAAMLIAHGTCGLSQEFVLRGAGEARSAEIRGRNRKTESGVGFPWNGRR